MHEAAAAGHARASVSALDYSTKYRLLPDKGQNLNK
jgi:hypothetical protein